MVTQLVHEAVSLELTPDDLQGLLDRKWKALEMGVR